MAPLMETTEHKARKIIHVDMDAFYASVEQRDDPTLRGKPVIVGGRPGGRGVVASCSYEARKFGIRSAMSSNKASRLCPRALFVRANFSKYKEVSRALRGIFSDYTDLIEPLSLDEAYLDVTENKVGEPLARQIAQSIRARIKSELNLTASAGVGPNKFIAKVASDIKKPDGLCVIPPEKVLDFVAKLPVERLWGVGPATAFKLHGLGLRTALDLRNQQREFLYQHMGKFGLFLHHLSRGEDNRPVNPDRTPKSRGSETTFGEDILDVASLKKTLGELAEEVAETLQKRELPGKTVVLKVKYSDFSSITRSRTLSAHSYDAALIGAVVVDLLGNTEAGRRPIRLLGVSVSNLKTGDKEEEESDQLALPL